MALFRAGLCDRDVRAQCLELASAYNPDAARLLSRMYFCDLVIADISAIQHRWVARCFDQDEVIRRRAQALYVLLEAGSRHWGQHWGDLELRIYALDFGGEEGRR